MSLLQEAPRSTCATTDGGIGAFLSRRGGPTLGSAEPGRTYGHARCPNKIERRVATCDHVLIKPHIVNLRIMYEPIII